MKRSLYVLMTLLFILSILQFQWCSQEPDPWDDKTSTSTTAVNTTTTLTDTTNANTTTETTSNTSSDGITNTISSTSNTYNPDLVAVKTPDIEPDGGFVFDETTITILCATTNAKIYYTLDGTDPTDASTLYGVPFVLPLVLDTPLELRAIAYHDDTSIYYPSVIDTETYTLKERVKTPDVTPAPQEFMESLTVELTCGTEGATIKYNINNNVESDMIPYEGPINLQYDSTVYAVAQKDGMTQSLILEAPFTKPKWEFFGQEDDLKALIASSNDPLNKEYPYVRIFKNKDTGLTGIYMHKNHHYIYTWNSDTLKWVNYIATGYGSAIPDTGNTVWDTEIFMDRKYDAFFFSFLGKIDPADPAEPLNEFHSLSYNQGNFEWEERSPTIHCEPPVVHSFVWDQIVYIIHSDVLKAKVQMCNFVDKFWEPLGTSVIAAAEFADVTFEQGMDLYVTGTNDTNHVAWVLIGDTDNVNGVALYKFDGTNWVQVGDKIVTGNYESVEVELAVYYDIPYVSYYSYANSRLAKMFMFKDNAWLDITGNLNEVLDNNTRVLAPDVSSDGSIFYANRKEVLKYDPLANVWNVYAANYIALDKVNKYCESDITIFNDIIYLVYNDNSYVKVAKMAIQ